MVVVLGLAYGIPIVVWNLKQQAFAGVYHTGGMCGCGHHPFWEISGTNLFVLTPGHRDRKLMYTLQPEGDLWHAIRVEDGQLWFDIRPMRMDVEFERKKNGNKTTYPRVRNPWHLWWPRIMPE